MSAPSLDDQIRSHLEILEVAPGDQQAFHALVGLYEQASRWEDLIALYEGRARLAPGPGAPLLAQAANLAHRKLRNVARAEELYRQLLQTDPGHADAVRAMVALLEEKGDWGALAATLEREATRASEPTEAARLTLRLGQVQEERLGRRDRAALLYARANRLDPALAEARTRGLACFVALRRFGQARRMLDAARDAGADPRAIAAEYAALGARLVDEPLEHGLAMDALIEALTLDRNAPGAAAARERLRAMPRTWREEAARLGQAVTRAADRREAAALQLRLAQLHAAYDPEGASRALERIDRAWAAAPGNPFALELLARLFAERGDHRGHADALARLAAQTRDRAALVALHLEMARVDLVRFGDTESFVAALGRALELDPACESAALQVFEHHVDAGRFADALAVLERHLAAAPEKAAHAPLRVRAAALAREKLGDPARAGQHLEAALRADPGHGPAAAALAPLLADAGAWQRLAEVLDLSARWERDPSERVRLLERLADVQQEQLGRPRDALRTLARALAIDPARAATRKAMEGAAARADAFLELTRAYRAAAEAVDGDLKARKTLLRRVAEILDRDLSLPEEAVRAWRALVALDPEDRGAANALEACLARAGQQEELARELEEKRARATGDERRALSAKLAKLWADAGEVERAAAGWRDVLEHAPDDDEALWGLHAALEGQGGPRAAEERVSILGRLEARAKGVAERGAISLARAESLAEPLGRLADAAEIATGLVQAAGVGASQRADAAALLERLLARGVAPLPVAQVLAPAYAAAGDAAKHAAMLELLARSLPAGADPRERARHLLDASSVRAERLGDRRGALSAAAAALRACPDHLEARRRCEDLAREVGAERELLALLDEAAGRLEGRPEEAALRLRAAAVAEEDLGAYDDAAVQLRRAVALRPGDPGILAALTRTALAGERWAEAATLLDERAAAAEGAEKVALLAQEAEVLHERLDDPAGAAQAARDALAVAAPEQRPRLLARLAAALGDAGDAPGRADALAELAAQAANPAEASRAALESARIRAGLGDEKAAVERTVLALRASPDDPAALSALEAHLEGGDPEAVRAAAAALARHPDPRRRVRALEAEARVAPDVAGKVAARRAAARIAEQELRQASLAFAALAAASRLAPADAELRAELRRVAAEAGDVEACARLHAELAELAPPEQRLPILRERADLAERRLDPDRAAEAWAQVARAAPADREALAALRRLHRARERWGELADVCAEIARRSQEPAVREDALREEGAVAEARLADAPRAAQAWAEVAALAPQDAEAAAALERLYDRLDRPDALAAVLERRLARAFEVDAAARLAELRRTRLDDPAGALALHAELVRRDPRRTASRDALAELAAVPGPVGREALEAADRVLRAAGEHTRRVAAREARLAAVTDPGERARLLAELRTILETELDDPGLAFLAACRAFAEGGPAREGAGADLVRLAAATGSEAEVADVYEQAAGGAEPEEALALRRRAARVRTERGGGAAAIEAWNRVLADAPDDAEALEALAGLYETARSARELLDVARRRAALAVGADRAGHLLHAGALAEALEDPGAAAEAYRAVLEEAPLDVAALEGLDRILSRGPAVPELEWVIEALARAVADDPARRTALLLRRAGLLETDPDPRRAVEAYAEVLAESPREPGAVAGLERLLDRADARETAARVLEDVLRTAGDARRLAALLEVRLEVADASEHGPLLAEIAALHERLGDRDGAFRSKARELAEAARAGRDAPGARADLERLAAASGAWEALAAALEEAIEAGLPAGAALEVRRRLAAIHVERLGKPDVAARFYEEVAAAAPSAETLGALARVYRRLGAHRDLARTLERLADVAPAPAARKELLLEVAKIMAEHLSDREGAIQAYRKILAVDPEDPQALRLLGRLLGSAERWEDLVDVLGRELAVAERQPNLVAEAAELRYRLGKIRHQRLADAAGALAAYREVLAKVPRHPAALAALEELARSTGPAALEAALLLEPVYSAEGEHGKVVETLEARAANETDPARRAALLRRVAATYAGPLRNAEMAFLAASRALAADPDSIESLDLAASGAEAAGLGDELQGLLAEHADRARDPSARAEYQRRIARLARGGDAARAAEAWQRLLDLAPDDREALVGLIDALEAGTDPDALAQALRRALAVEELPEGRAHLLRRLAAVLDERLDDAAGAIQALRRLLELAASDRDALARLDRLCLRTERWVDLAEVLEREVAAAADAGDEAALVVLRQRLAELKDARLLDRDGALGLYEEVLQARPDHPEAIARLEALLQKDPGNARAALALERAYAAGGDALKQAAVLEVRAGERPDPEERKALYLELADLRERALADPELAFLALCKAFREDPADAAVRARMEALAGASGHEEELAAIYEDEIDRLPPAETAAVALRLGALYEERLGDPGRAAGFLRRALALDPAAAPEALPALERIHARLESWPELADTLAARAAAAQGPERVQLLFRVGQLCEEKLASPDRAAEAYEAAVQADPRHVPSLRALEALYEGAGRREDLVKNLAAQRAVAQDAASKERVLAKMAALVADLGRLDEAVALWKELLVLRPRHEAALPALEDLYESLERWQDLAQHLRIRIGATVDRREIARLNDKLGQVLGTRLGDATQAVQSYKAVLDSDPKNRRALEALRDIHAAQGDQDALVSVYRRLVPLQEDAAGVKRARLELAEVLLRAGQKRDAVEQAKLAFDIEPHGADDLVRIEEIFRQGGAAQDGVRAAEARAALLAAQGGPAEAVPAWLAVADLWRQQKRPDAAAAALDKVLELDPRNRTAYDGLRALHQEAGNWRAFARVCDLFAPQLGDPAEKVVLLKEVAAVHEKRLGQKEMSFLSWCRALAEAPGDAEALAEAERLAADTEAFEELSSVLEEIAEKSRGMVKAKLLLHLGSLQDAKLDDAAAAEGAYRRALEADPASPEALDALTQLFKRRGRVRDLVITLEQRLEAAAALEEKKALLLEVAKIYDAELHDVDEAVGALRRVLELDGGDAAALEALSTLYRREQRWADLAGILARARDLAATDAARIAYQLQIGALHENEIGDDEAAVEAYRTVLGLDDRSKDALAGLERLYTKLDRFAELNRVYERQIALAADPREQVRILAKSAAIHEEKLHDPRSAIERNEQILRLDGANGPAVKNLERLYRDEGLWDRLITVMQHHLSLVQERREQVALEVAIGEVWWKEMSRVDRAEAIFNHALQLDPDSRTAVAALGRLYERSGNWNLALDMLRREARVAGGSKDAVELYVRMGAIHEEMLLDVASAKEAYSRALQLDPGHLPAIKALKGLFERERNRDRYLELLVDEARYETDVEAKTERYTEAARVYQEERDDRESAARYYEEALKRTPGHLAAARPLSDIYVAQARWPDAERVLDGIVEALSQGGDAKELCRQSYRQGYVAEKLGNREKALAAYRRAYELDSTYLPALEGLGNLLVQEQQWEEALRIFTTVIIHHRDGLTDLEVVETHWQIGEIAAKLAQVERAANAFRKALEIDQNHEPSRRSLTRILESTGDFEGAVEQRQRLLPLLEGQAKLENLVAIGEICRDRLQDPYQAIDAFLGASRLDPTSLPVTEALLGLYRETRQGQKAADVLAQIVARPEVQADPARAAKLHLSLAEILRDEVKDEGAAVLELEKALDKNWRLVQAFAAIEEILGRQKRWTDLEQAYLRMVQRLPKTPDAAQARLALWKTLGDLYRNVLRNDDGARMAYQVVAKADPEDAVAVETFADLAARKPGAEREAIAAYRQLLRTGAKAPKAAQALVKLHATAKQYDPAYSAAQVLVHLLGQAGGEEVQVVARLRKFARDQASRPLDDQLWGMLLHERVKGPLADIMTLLALHARPLFVQKEKDLGVNPKKDELDVQGSMLFFANMFKYVERTLGLKGLRLFRKGGVPALLQLVPTDPPGFLAADEMFEERPKKELWFAIGKALAFARPELLMARLMPHDQLDLVFQAACSAGTSRFVVTADPHLVAKLKRELEKTLPEPVRKNTLKLLARAYCDVQHPGDVRSYLDGAELTSNRAGALLAGDLEVVRRAVLEERPQVSKLRDETRLRDLALFCVSEEYAALRERLGLSCLVPA
ncbi:tetratricopeptide repeat protein [Anaeromyxobacter oryzae]|uniref:tetratricopeptide repeat protein n=1 Tax=Anaeromyxobacter oryzae TaxID=2918170 RepID=UPI0020C0D090|nr:tetratricopeptide repeat protein [Anaeromyxobacter oryzae]